jgi:hypothetical protein
VVVIANGCSLAALCPANDFCIRIRGWAVYIHLVLELLSKQALSPNTPANSRNFTTGIWPTSHLGPLAFTHQKWTATLTQPN